MPQSATDSRSLARCQPRLLVLLCALLVLGGWASVAGARQSVASAAIQPAAGPSLSLLGQLAFPDAHPATRVVVAGRYAYVAYNDARFEGWGLRIVDVLNPQAPKLVGVYNVPHAPGVTGQVPSLALIGSYVYLAAGQDGLRVINVANPASPTEVRTYKPSAGSYIWDVTIAGSYAYVAAGGEGLRVLNISDLTNPIEVGDLPISSATLIDVVGSTVYVGAEHTLLIVDASDPSAPAQAGSFTLSDLTQREIGGIRVVGTIAYVTFGFCMRTCVGGLLTIDVSDPAHPTKLGAAGESLERPFGAIEVVGRYAFVGVDNGCSAVNDLCSGRLSVIDVADPAAPLYLTEAQLGTGPGGIAFAGNLVYVTDDSPSASVTGGRLSVFRYLPPLTVRHYVPVVIR